MKCGHAAAVGAALVRDPDAEADPPVLPTVSKNQKSVLGTLGPHSAAHPCPLKIPDLALMLAPGLGGCGAKKPRRRPSAVHHGPFRLKLEPAVKGVRTNYAGIRQQLFRFGHEGVAFSRAEGGGTGERVIPRW